MSELTELLPCPFCGAGETTFDDLTFGSGTVMTVRLRHNCGADDWPAIEFSGSTKAEIIAAWNRRHPAEAGEVVASAIQTEWKEAGFVEFINDDVPTIATEVKENVSILLDLTTRKVVGYRVYDPARRATESGK